MLLERTNRPVWIRASKERVLMPAWDQNVDGRLHLDRRKHLLEHEHNLMLHLAVCHALNALRFHICGGYHQDVISRSGWLEEIAWCIEILPHRVVPAMLCHVIGIQGKLEIVYVYIESECLLHGRTCQSPQNFCLNRRNIFVYVVMWKLSSDSRFHSGNMGVNWTRSLCNTPSLLQRRRKKAGQDSNSRQTMAHLRKCTYCIVGLNDMSIWSDYCHIVVIIDDLCN